MVNPLRPTKYTGMNQIFANFVVRPRRPTTADYRQPENAKLYRLTTVWQVGKNPSDGVEGELWMLSKIVANIATWVLISGGVVGTDLHVARFIVSAGGLADGANYTTINDAVTAASAAGGLQTIAIQPGTYTEDITIPANINLTAFPCDAFSASVNIVGTISCSDTGTRSLSGLRLTSNGAPILSVTGGNTTNLRLINCFLNGTDGPGIVNSSNGAGVVSFFYCFGSVSGANAVFTLSGGNTLNLYFSQFTGSTTTSTVGSGCDVSITSCNILFPITSSGTGAIGIIHSFVTSTVTSLTIGGTGAHRVSNCTVGGPAAIAAITIAAGCTLNLTLSEIAGSTPNVITGAGTINRGLLVFTGSGSTITVATQNALATI